MSNGSRYRTVHCLIWNDDKFPYMSDYGKLVFFHLLTTPYSTPFGCFKAGKASLMEESRMDSKGFSKGFAEGLEQGLFKYDERTLTVFLPRFFKHNKPSNPNVVKKWGKVFSEIPDGPLKVECYDVISARCEGLGKGFSKAFEEAFTKPRRKGIAIQEQEQEQEQEQNITTSVLSPDESGSEPQPADSVAEFPVLTIPLNLKGEFFHVYQKDVDGWQDTFQAIDVLQVLKECRQWSVDNPSRRKTKAGIRRHISAWLGKEHNSARPGNQRRGVATKQETNRTIQEARHALNQQTGFDPYAIIETGDCAGHVNENGGTLPEQ